MLYYIQCIITVFQRSMDLCFSIMSESFCFFQTPCCVYINEPIMQMLSSRDVLPNKCSPNVKIVVEKPYLWVSSFLTEMQFFSMQLDFPRENKIHRCLSRIFLKLLKNNYFAEQLLMAITLHDLSSLCAYIVL